MSGAVSRKRRGDEVQASRLKNDRFQKKRKRQQSAYHSDSDSIEGGDSDDDNEDLKAPTSLGLEGGDDDGSDDGFQAVDLLDSDEENLDALADDGATSDENDEMDLDGVDDDSEDGEDDSDSLDSLSDGGSAQKTKKKEPKKTSPTKAKGKLAVSQRGVPAARDAPTDSEGDDDDDDDDDEEDDNAYGSGDDDSDNVGEGARGVPKSKRNDPATFATSLSKILGTKLSSTRRADPVLARSADARESSRRVVDAGLEEKARRQMRLEKRAALERGRVKDVLIATARPQAEGADSDKVDTVGETTTTILATERRLRKVAQRGVVQLFNAVRAAQVQAAQARKQAKVEGIIGMDKREAKVTDMSRKGFLDLIASGGGGLKKGGLEEA
ncbi:uncharacterized protein SPSK_07670 [Sporothrix schenckii 1099-18]|uniref:Ribosomal RNA-processing protein 15 n=2 Tax=Sporothrix schenckii TaxID=29908 RepID=U7PZ93_SPOS1|nr:uncharacterized protein SPSK_07670 [Sporothrix schenckii 1099-18]ERT00939.1 hypothetical protein HMPREF1624_02173 [Sporothrix schenckii ATCC 58251]KJR88051.1 hypothetical protein SPSK_07670 [Sporothrix schenckii 1099-18]